MSRRRILQGLAASAFLPMAARAERKLIATEFYEVAQIDVHLTSLDPAHDGLRIVQLSDLHIGSGVPDGRIINAVREVNRLAPDLVVLTGDFVTHKRDPLSRVPELLEPIAAPRVAVMGNHDYWSGPREIHDGLERIGISVLQNENTALRLRGVDFNVIGVDDCTTKHDDVDVAYRGAGRASRLILTHTPSCARKLPAWEDVLCLSGHTHGGQWDVPKLTKGVYQAAGQPWYKGAYTVRGNQLYVNRGLGFGKGTRLPRINSDPEVSVITLHHREPV
ncbi:MAG: metallophosphoesterase [Archangium sp.]|nr:metallophosphoesterase [Archangium sp.]